LPMHDTGGIVSALQAGTYTGSLLAEMQSSDGTVHYTYDATGQLIGADYESPLPSGEGQGEGYLSDESYTYDANGNRTNAGYVTGPDNRLLSDGTYWYEYDAEGNRTARYIDVDQSRTLTEGDTDVTQYTWDNRNRLVKVTDYEKYGGYAAQIVDYLYDVENRWIGENIDSNGDGKIDHQTRFAYDIVSPLLPGEGQGERASQIVLQFDKDGEGAVTGADLSHRYLWQPDAVDQLMADEQVTGVKEPGNVVWALGDNLGTVRDLATSQGGTTTIANHRVYDSFGNLQSQTNAAVDCLFGFTGRAFDEATGLQDNWHRKYDATTGGWLSKDPIGVTAGDANTSRYCNNSPTNATDPTGLAAEDIVDIVAVEAKNVWTWKRFLDVIAKTEPGDVVRYYGHSDETHTQLIFKEEGWFSGSEGHTQQEIAEHWGKASVFVIQSCGSANIAKYMAENSNGIIMAAVGTNVDIKVTRAQDLVGWFLQALGQGKTVQQAVNYANDQMKRVWKMGSQSEIVLPQLSCFGPYTDKTLQEIRAIARKKK